MQRHASLSASPVTAGQGGPSTGTSHLLDDGLLASLETSPAFEVTPQLEERLMNTYWAFAHPIWPILYRPSFDLAETRRSHPPLYYAILCIAAGRDVNHIPLAHSEACVDAHTHTFAENV
jgi:hypothetical protein